MKPIACILLVFAISRAAFAEKHSAEKGTLVSIVLHDTSSFADNYPDSQPGRVPPGPVTYTFEITVRQGCMEYAGLYDSYRKKFTDQFKPGESVEVRVTKRLLYVTVQSQEEPLRMPLSSHHEIAGCKSGK